MSVSETTSIPIAQPASGSVLFQPMGGDGWTSPQGRYEIDISLAMNVSGGTWRIAVQLDPQYMNLVALMQLETDQASDTIPFAMDMKLKASTNIFRVAGDLLQLDSASCSRLWSVPPAIDVKDIDFRLDNTDTFTGRATATIYVFRKGAQHIIPIDKIFQCLVRAGSVT